MKVPGWPPDNMTRWRAATSMRTDGLEKLDRTTMLIIAIGLGGLMLAAFIML